MATVFSHPVVALGLLPWFRDVRNSKTLLVTGMLLSILPDLDVLAFKLGIPYEHFFGHRGFTHSLLFAALISGGCTWFFTRFLRKPVLSTWVFLFLCMASHGVIDAFTDGGLGIAFFSPFDNGRYFFPYQPIEVSTLSVQRFFNGQGAGVLVSELKWIWLPSMMIFLFGLGGLIISKRCSIRAS